MKEDAEGKARRRRNIRESFPVHLTQVLGYDDTVQVPDGIWKAIFAQVSVIHAANCLATMKSYGDSIKNEMDLIATLNLSKIQTDNNVDGSSDTQGVEEINTDCLASLLMKC